MGQSVLMLAVACNRLFVIGGPLAAVLIGGCSAPPRPVQTVTSPVTACRAGEAVTACETRVERDAETRCAALVTLWIVSKEPSQPVVQERLMWRRCMHAAGYWFTEQGAGQAIPNLRRIGVHFPGFAVG
jgi:hypothetical protein